MSDTESVLLGISILAKSTLIRFVPGAEVKNEFGLWVPGEASEQRFIVRLREDTRDPVHRHQRGNNQYGLYLIGRCVSPKFFPLDLQSNTTLGVELNLGNRTEKGQFQLSLFPAKPDERWVGQYFEGWFSKDTEPRPPP